MKTLLFIHNSPLNEAYGGSRVTEASYNALSKQYLMKNIFIGKKSNKLMTLFRNMCFYSGGLSPFDVTKIVNYIKECNDIDMVFFNVSLHGRLVRKIKLKFPNIKVIVFFENNEKKFFFDLVKLSGLIYLPIWFSVSYNEKLSLEYSDLNIFLTEHDKLSFGVLKTPSVVIPVTLSDKYRQSNAKNNGNNDSYVLFVGSAFFANIEGVLFIIKKIAPSISCNILIVGKGIKKALSKENIPNNVTIEDFVKDLSEIYNGAAAFIAPLFYGSGMKIKLAEAMMYGKKIIATSLAFCGYKINKKSCVICDTDEDFIREINDTDMSKTFYRESREIFLNNYSSSNNDIYYSQIKDYL